MDEYIFKIVVLGNTGVGKSSLCNMLAGNQNAFKVGDEGTSQTQLTSETQLTVYKEFKLMGKPDGIKLLLVDTQGLSDTGGDAKDMQHIKNMVERIRELETIDLFLLCLDGMNPRFTAYVQSTISLFSDIFPDFLHHTVMVFNKWNIPQQERKATLMTNYRQLISRNFNHNNIPCFFIDSFFNLKMLRDNDDGTQTERELHPSIQARTHAQIVGLMSFLVSKSTYCDVRNIIPKDTKFAGLIKEKEAAEKDLQTTIERNKEEIQNLRIESENRINEINAKNQAQINNLYTELFACNKRKRKYGFWHHVDLLDKEYEFGKFLSDNSLFKTEFNPETKNELLGVKNLLPNKISNFSGRIQVLNEIKNAFYKDKNQIVILKSISGTGKSAIAIKYGWELASENLANVFWFKSDDLDNIETAYKKFSKNFEIKIDNKSKQDIIECTNDKIKDTNENYLFIFDNCEDIQHISSYISNMPNNANILITTNKNLNIDDKSLVIDVKPFTRNESENFINENLNKSLKEEEIKYINDLIFGYFKNGEIRPYTLNKFVILINAEIQLKPLNYNFIEYLQKKKDFILNEIINGDRLFLIMNEIDNNALQVLHYISFMNSDFIPLQMLDEIAKKDSFDKLINLLISFSFINMQHDAGRIGVKIHESFQNEIRRNLKEKDNIVKKMQSYLKSILNLDSKNMVLKKEEFSNIKKIKENIISELENEDKCSVLDAFSNYCFKFRKYKLALENYSESLGIKRLLFGTCENQSIANTLIYIGLVYKSLKDYKSALDYYTESLRIIRLIIKSKNQIIAILLNNIGYLNYKQGNNELALKNLKESLEIKQLIFYKNDNLSIVISLNCLAQVYENLGQKDLIADTLNNIGLVYKNLGKYELALNNLNESLRINKLVFGTDEDKSIADILNNIALVYECLGDNEQALNYSNESTRIKRLAETWYENDTIDDFDNIPISSINLQNTYVQGFIFFSSLNYNKCIN